MEYEIRIKVNVGELPSGIYCSFWFKNPLVDDNSLMTETKRKGESNMQFVKRIKEYIQSNEFIHNLKKRIINDAEEYHEKQRMQMDYDELRKELDGMEFSVKVDLD